MDQAGVIGSKRAGGRGGAGGSGGHERRKRLRSGPEAVRREIGLEEPERLPEISGEAFEAWMEGVNHLGRSRDCMEALAQFRGWPMAWARHLVDGGAISMPFHRGRRTIAFLVEAPEGGGGGMTMRKVGFHCRLKPRPGEEKAGWRFVPNAKEHGQSTPALPFILGGSSFDSARLLVITGGQWDALTFAFAAGWLGEGCQWPEGACVIGIRGDSSTNVFLRYYARFWPASANCLLLPDADLSGGKWVQAPDSFAKRLSARCRKVAVVTFGSHKDFNDLHRGGNVTPGMITGILAAHGMAMEEEVAI
jgi:hypothetical protein